MAIRTLKVKVKRPPQGTIASLISFSEAAWLMFSECVALMSSPNKVHFYWRALETDILEGSSPVVDQTNPIHPLRELPCCAACKNDS